MKNKDNLQRFLFENMAVRGEFVRLEDSFQQIIDQHHYSEALSQLLGEALVVVNLLAAIIKFKGRITVQFQGKGKLKLLLAQCNQHFEFRGVAQCQDEPTDAELLEALKQGTLAIMIDPEDPSKQRYQGIVAWQGQSLAESIEGYFRDSEQLPTRLWLSVDKTKAVGLLLQILPQKEELTDNPDWEHVVHLANTLQPDELLHFDNTTLLHRLYHQDEVRLFEPVPVHFRCTCSQERSENALLLLGYDEVIEELKNKRQIAVTCEFCNKSYAFERADIDRIFHKGDNSHTQVH